MVSTAAAAHKWPAATAVCVGLVLSSLRQPATATYCSDCGSACDNRVTSTCGDVKPSVMRQCMPPCGGTYYMCYTSCSSAANNAYNSCKSAVYQHCWDTCNGNCTKP